MCLDKREDIEGELKATGQGEEYLESFMQFIRSMANTRGVTQ